MARCTLGNTIAYCISSGRCKCENAELQAKLDQAIAELAAPALKEEDQREKQWRRAALESDLRRTGRNNAVYVVRYYGQLVIREIPEPWPFVRAFSGEHPSKHAAAYIESVTGNRKA